MPGEATLRRPHENYFSKATGGANPMEGIRSAGVDGVLRLLLNALAEEGEDAGLAHWLGTREAAVQ